MLTNFRKGYKSNNSKESQHEELTQKTYTVLEDSTSSGSSLPSNSTSVLFLVSGIILHTNKLLLGAVTKHKLSYLFGRLILQFMARKWANQLL